MPAKTKAQGQYTTIFFNSTRLPTLKWAS